MASITIITDTDANLPAPIAENQGIRQVPIAIHIGHETYKTGVDIYDSSLFQGVDAEGTLPTSSAPAPLDFLVTYRSALDEGADQLICLCVSSEVSGTYDAACTARDMLLEHDTTLVDTQSIAMGRES